VTTGRHGTNWRRLRLAVLVVTPLLTLGVIWHILVGVKGPYTAPFPDRAAAAATVPRIHPTVPRIYPTVPRIHPTVAPPRIIPTATHRIPLVRSSPTAAPTHPKPAPIHLEPPPTRARPGLARRLPLSTHAEWLRTRQSDWRRRARSVPVPRTRRRTLPAGSVSPTPVPTASGTPIALQAFPSSTSQPAHIATARVAVTVAVTVPVAPMRLRIPALNLDAHIESVGLSGNAMDVPANAWDVAWFKLGPRPGMAGNAVIDGHLDTATGPAVFLHLSDLRAGDLLYATTADGVDHTFKVTELANYPVDGAPVTRIFGPSNGAHLNLITCSGDWLPQQHIYNERLVVYSTLVR
jgi:hypothetical protein